jgi:hypothetical protein
MFWFFLAAFVPFAAAHSWFLHNRTQRLHCFESSAYFFWFLLSVALEPFSAAFIVYSLGNLIPQNVDPELRVINDVIHYLVPYTPDLYYYVANPLVIATIVFLFALMICDSTFRERALFTLGSAMLLRDLTIFVTQLPLTQLDMDDTQCIEYASLSYIDILKHTLQGFACGDYNYSGHTIFFTVGFIGVVEVLLPSSDPDGVDVDVNAKCATLAKARRHRKWWISVLFALYLGEMLCMVISRAHYTIDVIESCFITTTFYYCISPFVTRYFDRLAQADVN